MSVVDFYLLCAGGDVVYQRRSNCQNNRCSWSMINDTLCNYNVYVSFGSCVIDFLIMKAACYSCGNRAIKIEKDYLPTTL